MAAKPRRRRNSGDLCHLRVEVWSTILFLSSVVEDGEADMEHRLKAASGICVSSGVYRAILADIAAEKTRTAMLALQQHEHERNLAFAQAQDEQRALEEAAEVDAEEADLEDDAPGCPDARLWERCVTQALMVGAFADLEVSRSLGRLPPANKALVQAEALRQGPRVYRRLPVRQKVAEPLPAPVVTVVEPDPDEISLKQMERQVQELVDAIRHKTGALAGDDTPPRSATHRLS